MLVKRKHTGSHVSDAPKHNIMLERVDRYTLAITVDGEKLADISVFKGIDGNPYADLDSDIYKPPIIEESGYIHWML